MAHALILALTTEASHGQAQAMAEQLLERRLAACVTLMPVTSHYRWQGQLEQSTEVQLQIKTDASRLQALEQAVRELHSYDTPEWLHWPAGSNDAYGAWVHESCAAS